MQRVLEPEVMDTWEEAIAYDAMDFTEVNADFAARAIALGPTTGLILDGGTGSARIPILLCQHRPQWQVIAIDLSENMLKVGQQNITQAKLEAQIHLALVDAKTLPYADARFDMVVSNSLIHHLPEPLPFLQELKRVLKPGGGIFLRDLLRPANAGRVDDIVNRIGPESDRQQRQLFHASLCAALSLEELADRLQTAGLEDVLLYQSSDRHWTVERPWKAGWG